MSTPQVIRLAPSPTGAMHLGNARTFILTWLYARAGGWRLDLRIEDLDGPRVRAGAAQQAIDDLGWLGIDWDRGPIFQSARRRQYADAIERLVASGRAYPCVCSRGDVERVASAPHAEDGAAVYPGTCRGRFPSVEAARDSTGRPPVVRFRVEDDRVVRWHDRVGGERALRLGVLGDFVVAKADGTPAYQLAVVVDDAAAGVSDVVRGDDLLDSTPRQMALYEALNLGPPPAYYHVPLVVGPDGRRLAKRHGDTRVATYRDAGVPAGRVLAWAARCSGITLPTGVADEALVIGDLLAGFDPAKLAGEAIVFCDADDRAIRAGAKTH